MSECAFCGIREEDCFEGSFKYGGPSEHLLCPACFSKHNKDYISDGQELLDGILGKIGKVVREKMFKFVRARLRSSSSYCFLRSSDKIKYSIKHFADKNEFQICRKTDLAMEYPEKIFNAETTTMELVLDEATDMILNEIICHRTSKGEKMIKLKVVIEKGGRLTFKEV